MALSAQERQILDFGLKNGKTQDEVQTAIAKYRQETAQTAPKVVKPSLSPIADRTGDIAETGQAIGASFGKAGEDIVSTIGNKNLNPFEKVVQVGGQAFKGGASAFGELVMGAGKVALPQVAEDAISDTVQGVVQKVAEQPFVQDLVARYQALNPEMRRNIDNALGYAEGLAEIATGGAASRIVKPVVDTAVKAVEGTVSAAGRTIDDIRARSGSLFQKPATNVEEVIAQVDAALLPARAAATPPGALPATAQPGPAPVSFREKWVGISPDIKARIAGKQDKLQEYFDVAHARNKNDLVPTPFEYGAQQAQNAVEKMDGLINESGGRIGATREKLGTYQANVDQVGRIETSFTTQLGKLNLEVRNGVVRQKPGTITKVGSGDIKVLNGLYGDLLTIKQSPNLTNLIEYRTALDSRVNFAKRAAEASNEIDPFSRQLRKDIADVGAEIVGRSEAAELERFSNFMEAYTDLRSYTDRRAGGEYLLRLVLSGRGGEARQIIQTIREYTGIDLMDDATMMMIATDVIGNSRQQNLFRQEMTKAGLDVASLMSGNPGGGLSLLWDVVSKRLVDGEKTFLEAAR